MSVPETQPFTLQGEGRRWEYRRYICTAAQPYVEDYGGRWEHTDARTVDEEYCGLTGGGNYRLSKCPHCGLEFREQMPD